MTPTAPVEPEGILTLAEAADRLGVHYMTAYRYVRTGRLDAHKDGVEWRVRRADVDALAEAGTAAAGRTGRTPRPAADWASRVEERLLAGDEAGAWTVVQAALSGGTDPEGIYLDMLAPALVSIGDRWAAGEVTVAQEHRASVVALRLIGRLGPQFSRRGRKRGTIVLGAPPDDRHAVPLALVADLLRARSFAVVDLGADTPTVSFVDQVSNVDRLLAVGISATTTGNDDNIRATVAALKAATDVPIVLGGNAIRDDVHARLLGADQGTTSALDAIEVFEGIADEAGRARRRASRHAPTERGR